MAKGSIFPCAIANATPASQSGPRACTEQPRKGRVPAFPRWLKTQSGFRARLLPVLPERLLPGDATRVPRRTFQTSLQDGGELDPLWAEECHGAPWEPFPYASCSSGSLLALQIPSRPGADVGRQGSGSTRRYQKRQLESASGLERGLAALAAKSPPLPHGSTCVWMPRDAEGVTWSLWVLLGPIALPRLCSQK